MNGTKPDKASKYLDAARKRAPDNPEVERSLAGFFREAGKYPEAIAALKSIRNPKPDVTAELAYTYQLDGKPDDSAYCMPRRPTKNRKIWVCSYRPHKPKWLRDQSSTLSPF